MHRFCDQPKSQKSINEICSEYTSLNGDKGPTYFTYQDISNQKKSSKYDPENPNRNKLGTFDGVFVPTTLNVISILMFLRFGFILGQIGVLGAFSLLILSYIINLLTTLSISAISTNGTIRGGGAYYMISRCLGPEFGGSIGLIFFLGQILNSGMNAVGIIEPLLYNFGYADENQSPALMALLPKGYWYEFTYSTLILFFCLSITLIGSQSISRAGNILFWLLLISTLSIPFSVLISPPFNDGNNVYTGPSWSTFHDNLFPNFTKGAAGSLLDSKENFRDIFGIFFPATAGIFAGAGMSSELRKPSKSIPKGTLWGLLLTFIFYSFVILSLGCSVTRESLYKNVQIIQTISSTKFIILIGELSTSLFSIIVGIVGAAYVLEAISRDSILPGLSIFHKSPYLALFFTWVLTQLCLLLNVNQIATFITMTFLMTFIVMNLACFLLEISSAPNFRPSFNWFNRHTALCGGTLSIMAMFIVDGTSASLVIFSLVLLFILIHFFCPPKSWGDVSQSLIYHQVRKYLLRLRQDNVKYWRPQILLLVDNPRTSWKLIRFCNHLKKGGLYILGHVTVSDNFQNQFHELNMQTNAWLKIRDIAQIKAFVQISTGPTLPWGIRNVFLGSGLGGMKPNITVLGFFDLKNHRHMKRTQLYHFDRLKNHECFLGRKANKFTHLDDRDDMLDSLPTDSCKNEEKIGAQQWIQIIEDLSLMHSNIAIARGFKELDFPGKHNKVKKKNFIDLYPIQMSAKIFKENSSEAVITTNFDTYTLILQLGAILVTVPEWRATHQLRVIVFVEFENERPNEKNRIDNLLNVLRIEAEVLIVSLDHFRVYNTIIKGDSIQSDFVTSALQGDNWWEELVKARSGHMSTRRFTVSYSENIKIKHNKQLIKRYNISQLQRLGVSLTMMSNTPVGTSDSFFEESNDDDDIFQPPLLDFYESENKHPKNQTDIKNLLELNKKKSNSSRSRMPVFISDAIPKTKVIEDANGNQPSLIPILDEQMDIDELEEKCTSSQIPSSKQNHSFKKDGKQLSFNEIPSRAQYLILNDMMKQISGSSNLIFSTLPIPLLGLHKDEKASLQYIEDLDVWLDTLPPTLLINSQSMTVTTAL